MKPLGQIPRQYVAIDEDDATRVALAAGDTITFTLVILAGQAFAWKSLSLLGRTKALLARVRDLNSDTELTRGFVDSTLISGGQVAGMGLQPYRLRAPFEMPESSGGSLAIDLDNTSGAPITVEATFGGTELRRPSRLNNLQWRVLPWKISVPLNGISDPVNVPIDGDFPFLMTDIQANPRTGYSFDISWKARAGVIQNVRFMGAENVLGDGTGPGYLDPPRLCDRNDRISVTLQDEGGGAQTVNGCFIGIRLADYTSRQAFYDDAAHDESVAASVLRQWEME